MGSDVHSQTFPHITHLPLDNLLTIRLLRRTCRITRADARRYGRSSIERDPLALPCRGIAGRSSPSTAVIGRWKSRTPPARHRLPGGCPHDAHRPRPGKQHRLQQPRPRNVPHRRLRPLPLRNGPLREAPRRCLEARARQTSAKDWTPTRRSLPGTARFRRPPSVSESLPNPAAARQQRHSTATPINPRQAGENQKTSPQRRAGRTRIRPRENDIVLRTARPALALEEEPQYPLTLGDARTPSIRCKGRFRRGGSQDPIPFAVHPFRRSPSAERSPHRSTTCRVEACRKLEITRVPLRKARRR